MFLSKPKLSQAEGPFPGCRRWFSQGRLSAAAASQEALTPGPLGSRLLGKAESESRH